MSYIKKYAIGFVRAVPGASDTTEAVYLPKIEADETYDTLEEAEKAVGVAFINGYDKHLVVVPVYIRV